MDLPLPGMIKISREGNCYGWRERKKEVRKREREKKSEEEGWEREGKKDRGSGDGKKRILFPLE